MILHTLKALGLPDRSFYGLLLVFEGLIELSKLLYRAFIEILTETVFIMFISLLSTIFTLRSFDLLYFNSILSVNFHLPSNHRLITNPIYFRAFHRIIDDSSLISTLPRNILIPLSILLSQGRTLSPKSHRQFLTHFQLHITMCLFDI